MKTDFKIYNTLEHQVLIKESKEVLSDAELERSKSFIKEQDKENYLIQKILLRQILGSKLNLFPKKINFDLTDKGKPYIAQSDIHFNVSHSQHYFLIAISDVEIGADIEVINKNRNIEALAKKIMSRDEITYYDSLIKEKKLDYFYKIWTQKEAYTKCLGTGLTTKLEDINLKELNNFKIETHKTSDYYWSIVKKASLPN